MCYNCTCEPHRCCYYLPRHRQFLSKREEIELLKKYMEALELEIAGVKEKLSELQSE